MPKCVACGDKSTVRLSPDLDIKGFDVCDKCKDEFKTDLMLAFLDEKMMKRFNKKYKL